MGPAAPRGRAPPPRLTRAAAPGPLRGSAPWPRQAAHSG